ncbi:MAG: hypothetical protein O7D86_09555 [Proteobacteria bacterium]|nr:hypothetical protein [Pseudomonadota bacterium]
MQIKGRAIFNEKRQGHRIGQLKLEQEWDAIILVIMNADFMSVEIYMAKRDIILTELEEKQKNNKKGAMTVAKFKLIAELLWTEQNGLEQGGHLVKQSDLNVKGETCTWQCRTPTWT